jgi:acyl-CoA reductase-like NAD-dependent aldehyde dehydrogenase
MTHIDWIKRAEGSNFEIRNFINGQFEPVAEIGAPHTVIHKYSPRDGNLLYSFSEGAKADIDKAVSDAREAFNDGRWRKLPLPKRAAVLNTLADLVEKHKEQFALYECLDVGKTITNALKDDIARTIGRLRRTASLAGQLMAPSGADLGCFAYQRRKPVGVVGGIAGWNYPLTLAVSQLAPALIMGNCLVLKPSEFTSLSAAHLAALAIEAGVPPGVFNVVHGAGHTVGSALAEHLDVDLLSFVGSSATGKKIMVSAGQSNMKRLLLECGGKSPYMVFDDCPDDLNFIAQDIVNNAFPNQGALCAAGTRLLLQDTIREKLLPLIVEKAAAIRPADPLNPNSTFGALVNETHINKVLNYIAAGISEGAELILGGQRVFPVGDESLKGGFYIEPTIFDNVAPTAKIAQEEIFGPVLSVLTFKDESEAIRIANNSSFGLAAYAATTNLARAQRLGEQINAGVLITMGDTNLSGGGVNIGSDKHRQSGFGFSGGLEGLASYSISTTVHVLT